MKVELPQPIGNDRQIRLARAEERDGVLDILSVAAAWLLRDKGIAQWRARFPDESVSAQIEAGDLYVIDSERGLVATVVIADSEPELWPDDAPALHVSRLAIRREVAGQGLGAQVLEWVYVQAQCLSLQFVRLATSPSNHALRAYYETAGYSHQGDLAEAKWPTSLYQRPVGASHESP